MSADQSGYRLTVVVCGAGPAADVPVLVEIARAAGWAVNVIATPAALSFLDLGQLERLSGTPVRFKPRNPGEPRDRSGGTPDAIVVAPATFNTINKLATGIADNYALTVLAEVVGVGTRVVVVPFVNAALAGRAPYRRSIDMLRAEGVRVVEGPDDGWLPHPPGTGETHRHRFPWRHAFALAQDEIKR